MLGVEVGGMDFCFFINSPRFECLPYVQIVLLNGKVNEGFMSLFITIRITRWVLNHDMLIEF